jgi:hypothetical protein
VTTFVVLLVSMILVCKNKLFDVIFCIQMPAKLHSPSLVEDIILVCDHILAKSAALSEAAVIDGTDPRLSGITSSIAVEFCGI